ncbi:MAG: SHOCT domain-containing protein [Clostridia bacterium]|nr:SHOCT domain-containing protein [Clostridia bacterium]
MSDLMKTNMQVKRPLLAILFWAIYGAETLLLGLFSGVSVILSTFDAHNAFQGWERIVASISNLLISTQFLPVALAVLLIVISLLRKKCGKMMVAGGLLLIFSKVFVIVLNLLKDVVLSSNGQLDRVWRILLLSDLRLGSIWFSCLPHVVLGLFLVMCASKKAREGFCKIWILPFFLVAAPFATVRLLNTLNSLSMIQNTDILSVIISFVVNALFSGVTMLIALFFTLWWLKDPYKKEQPAAETVVAEESMATEEPVSSKEPEPSTEPVKAEESAVANEAVAPVTAEPAAAPAETTAQVVVQAAHADKSERGEQLRNSLAEYKALYEAGLITEAEFTEKKRQLLGL